MTYRELLPDNCPPDAAEEIDAPRVVYGLVRNNPSTDDDFRSELAERLDRIFRNITECQTRGRSVRTDLNSAMELMGFRTMRGGMLCQVQLDHGAGRIMQTGEDRPQQVVAIGGLRHNGKLLPGDDMKTVKHTNTIVYYDGVRVFAGQDAVGDHYVGAMIDTAGDADRYLVVAVAADPRRQFYAGELDLRALILESSADGWYTALVGDDFERPISLESEQGRLLEMDYLPEAGFRLRKAPADDLIPANPGTD